MCRPAGVDRHHASKQRHRTLLPFVVHGLIVNALTPTRALIGLRVVLHARRDASVGSWDALASGTACAKDATRPAGAPSWRLVWGQFELEACASRLELWPVGRASAH